MSGSAIKACPRRRVIFVNGRLPPVRWQALNRILLVPDPRVLHTMQTVQLDRQLRPIYGEHPTARLLSIISSGPICLRAPPDAIDSGSNKTAILACNKLLKKIPNNNLVKVRRFESPSEG